MKDKTVFPWKVFVTRIITSDGGVGIYDGEGKFIANIDTEEHADMIVAAVNEKNPQVSEEGAIRKEISVDIEFLINKLKDLQYVVEKEDLDHVYSLCEVISSIELEDILADIDAELLDK